MGVWGSTLYANDIASDVRDTYMKLLKQQYTDIDAFRETVDINKEYIDTDEECFLWYALADTQWNLGRLLPEVKERALLLIEAQDGIAFWAESKNKGYGWLKTLEKLKIKLQSPMPLRKKINREAPFQTNPWCIGDIYAYRFSDSKSDLCGKYIVMQKLSDEDWFEDKMISRIQIYNKIFENIPTLNDLDGVKILPLDDPNLFLPTGRNPEGFPLSFNAVIDLYKKRHYPKTNLVFIGNQQDKFNLPFANINFSYFEWLGIEETISFFYNLWQDCDYKLCEEDYIVYKKNNNSFLKRQGKTGDG